MKNIINTVTGDVLLDQPYETIQDLREYGLDTEWKFMTDAEVLQAEFNILKLVVPVCGVCQRTFVCFLYRRYHYRLPFIFFYGSRGSQFRPHTEELAFRRLGDLRVMNYEIPVIFKPNVPVRVGGAHYLSTEPALGCVDNVEVRFKHHLHTK